ncbi:ubiquitin recognition factor in ER-associated degradation protein 1-like [Actinia tenebrosa]|uniref:Ubiquitin recognition factor in ER-associated degradation protein 1-like n=1 Tax=Actinia tenebrosa TaxID=6105 RepID=A0A6P8HNW1_ACTTE|nr:ubiquitin recognition factor in ER-associated degradation protein 1-like [Actinia tenebrosa]
MFGFNMFEPMPRNFKTQYRCYSVVMFPGNEREDVERGGKIIMPPSALDQLTRLNIVYPMLFKLTNKKINRTTHCGVLEFVADEGKIYLPYWMMRNMLLEEGSILEVESASLPVASFAKFQPQSCDFLDITNPKAVLENALRSFACLTTGDIIAIKYNDKVYEFLVMETKPGRAVSIIECDMQVEFAAPVGYVEPSKQGTSRAPMDEQTDHPHPATQVVTPAFPGEGNRLDGKRKKNNSATDSLPLKPVIIKRGIPNYDYKPGKITFKRNLMKPTNNQPTENIEDFEPFGGEGQTIRQKRKSKR